MHTARTTPTQFSFALYISISLYLKEKELHFGVFCIFARNWELLGGERRDFGSGFVFWFCVGEVGVMWGC